MNRRAWVCIACLTAAVIPSLRAADDDPIKAKLDAAKVVYESDMTKFRGAVTGYFDKRENAARKDGNKKLVDQIKAERRAFADSGELPKTLPANIKTPFVSARSSLESAYKTAIKEYTRAKKDDQAGAVEKTLIAFQNGWTRPNDAVEFGGKYYKVFDDSLSWHDAQKKCVAMGGHLVVVTKESENEFVVKLIADAKLNSSWLGATDEKREGEWVWVTGARMTYSNWYQQEGWKEPNNYRGVEHYPVVELARRGKWFDTPPDSGERKGFICQWD